VESPATLAAIAWTNRLLIDRLEELFESFVSHPEHNAPARRRVRDTGKL
jgi:hypothetical protein